MLGAIIGDIVGFIYEWRNIKSKDFPLFGEKCFFTDDTVMTIAIAEGLLNGGGSENFVEAMKRLAKLYPGAGYGGSFQNWLFMENSKPYNSWGNGSAMRVSPVGWWFTTLEKTENMAEITAAVTHNHPEGIKGAQSVAAAIYLARNSSSKDEIKSYIEQKYGYDLSRTLDQIRSGYDFDMSCMRTVPEAITAFLESTDFEDSIRNAISLGGDSDTLSAITGSIAEAAYEIPEPIKTRAISFLEEPLIGILGRWNDSLKTSLRA